MPKIFFYSSGMLLTGVDRIIEQVVNPKVHKDFKPVIERIICDHLGIDIKQRQEREKKQLEILQQIQQRGSSFNIFSSFRNFLFILTI